MKRSIAGIFRKLLDVRDAGMKGSGDRGERALDRTALRVKYHRKIHPRQACAAGARLVRATQDHLEENQ